MRRFNTAIFDLDGTLMDTIDDIRTAIIKALDLDESKVTRTHVLNSINFGVKHLVETMAKQFGISCLDTDAAIKRFCDEYDKCYTDKTKPFDGMTELLCKLKALGYKIAVFSNKSNQFVEHLCDVKLPSGLVDIARGELAGVLPKPNPDGAYLILDALGAKNTDVAYIGDSDVDVATAKNCGFYCIGVSWGYREEQLLVNTGADIIAHDADELYDIITQEN